MYFGLLYYFVLLYFVGSRMRDEYLFKFFAQVIRDMYHVQVVYVVPLFVSQVECSLRFAQITKHNGVGHLTEEPNPHVLRVGWSLDRCSMLLGECLPRLGVVQGAERANGRQLL